MPFLLFDKQNMSFAFQLMNGTHAPKLDPSYFSLEIANIKLNLTSNEQVLIDKKGTKICEENDFTDKKFYSEHKLENSTCVDGNSSFRIGGDSNGDFQSLIRITLIPCSNDSVEDLVCKGPEQIRSYLKDKCFF